MCINFFSYPSWALGCQWHISTNESYVVFLSNSHFDFYHFSKFMRLISIKKSHYCNLLDRNRAQGYNKLALLLKLYQNWESAPSVKVLQMGLLGEIVMLNWCHACGTLTMRSLFLILKFKDTRELPSDMWGIRSKSLESLENAFCTRSQSHWSWIFASGF